ncbi:ribosome biogenesis GTPase A [Oceanospirillum multiglobuliferum]|uniref:Ribosome biogenesis GTPase A n=1 Tax=Oceanospirillum multiglobuliferum TaxID=64969 RepID=A0A1T4KJI8_9GAMM|nr:ribosome biogenesis GTPase YlqF [Oceanospirillum multiglobuliferum]OPX56053.1 ribosome biogenesis GTPase YlqF [Oceanospirillum multiglobuliferum]SJZ42579.1 ribosome biogenesis GTPase A [Oceanospirillum multiglobuliferum]
MLGWYPGHMNKARRQIKDALPEIDVIIEVLDARLPYSSENPMLAEIRGNKPCLKILSRDDLADPVITKLWLRHFESEVNTRAIPVTTTDSKTLRQIPKICKEMAGQVRKDRAVRVMVMGIPNVGKSTLINSLAGKKVAKVGNEPAVTKRQQKIILDTGIAIIDTPGVLWPRIEDQNSAYRLATSGAIRNTAVDYLDIAMFAAAELAIRYPKALIQRYKMNSLPETAEDILQLIASKRGGIRSGGEVDWHKAAEVLLNDLRAGHMGRISLEKPDDIPEPVLEDENTEQAVQPVQADSSVLNEVGLPSLNHGENQ